MKADLAKKYPNCTRGHKYALDVTSGAITACKYIIGACNRYLRDLESDGPYRFDWDDAEKYLRLVQRFEHVKGKWPTKEIVYEPWQCFVWMNVIGFKVKETGFRRFRIAHIEVARGNAKLHCVKTPVPTPDGMKIWGDIEVGSRLYDRHGGICRVIGKTPIHSPQMYEIEFSDGEKLKVSDKHLWFTQTKGDRSRQRKHAGRELRKTKANNTIYEYVRSTEEIAGTLRVGGKMEVNHSVTNTKPIVGEKKKLPIDPYVFGYWLGNGSKGTGNIWCHEDDRKEVEKLFSHRGYKKSRELSPEGRGVGLVYPSLRKDLIVNGLESKDVIPENYFLSNIHDRQEFVRGLLDSDGSINPAMRGQVSFTAKRGLHADALARLLHSLGYKISRARFKVSKNNNFKSDTLFYKVSFYPRGEEKVFNLARKRNFQVAKSGGHSYVGKRYIVGCKKLRTKHPGFCVEVDSPDKSYLIGNGHIPTHNSAMASQAVLYFLALDDPNGNEISTVATKKEQARIVLDSARAMARKSRSYLLHTGVEVLAHTIVHRKSDSIVRAMSSDHSGLDGLNDVLAVCDELHAMSRDVFEVIYSGMSKRKDSLTLCITTAGHDVHSVGYSQSAYAKKVAMGDVSDEQFFSAVYTLDEGDDWSDEKNWIKANPGLGVSVDIDSLRAKVEKALVTPADIPNIRIKHMDEWIAEARAFFDQQAWDKCADPNLKLEDFLNEQCRLGIDLASHIDIASIGIVFRKDGIYYIFDKSYLPEETIKQVRNTLYDDCVAKKFLIQTKGAAINYEFIQDEARTIAKNHRVIECLYDAWNATETAQKLSSEIEMVKVAMNVANFSEPMKKLDAYIREGKVRHNGSPLLRWCLGNVVAKEDHNGNVFPRKSHEKLKIDPIIAILMALAGWIQDPDEGSVYETHGIRTL